MSERSDKVRILDMLDVAERIRLNLEGVGLATFLSDADKRDATVFRLQVIGEAAYKISSDLKVRNPQVEWIRIQGLRHKIVHDYYALDDQSVFRIATEYVPPLVAQLRKILEAGVE